MRLRISKEVASVTSKGQVTVRSGFGMLKSRRATVPAHFDPAMCSTIEHPKRLGACAAKPQGRKLR